MKSKKILLSLCIPTNGVSEWVFPVLDSIFSQNVDEEIYEVIVTNNGNNEAFEKKIVEYLSNHRNLVYKKTNAVMFDNQIEALKLANGEYLKFINHRLCMLSGSLNYFLEFVKNNLQDKPVAFFSNGVFNGELREYDNFDSFVRGLQRYASWTTGVGIWKEQYENIPSNTKVDKISPHSFVLFSERNMNKYIIDDRVYGLEIEHNHTKKGNYDLFKAFAVEEFLITLGLYADGDISAQTVKIIKEDYKKFVSSLYWQFVIRKQPCSYKTDGFSDAMGIIFSKREIIICAYKYGISRIIKKVFKR